MTAGFPIIATLDALLADADFGHTLQVGIDAERRIVAIAADLANGAFRGRMLTELFNEFDLTFAGHTLAAYRRLPHGWRTSAGVPLDRSLHVAAVSRRAWCRARSATGADRHQHMDDQRPHLSDRERADELAHWRAQASTPEFRERLWRLVAESLAAESVAHQLDAARMLGG